MNGQSRTPPVIWLLATGVAVVSAVIVLAGHWLDNAPAIMRSATAFGFGLLTLWLGFSHWRSLDEAAREAHKAAWYWGGSAGLGLSMILLGYVVNDPAPLRLLPSQAPAWLFVFGGAACVGLQVVGYLVAWAIWWLRRR